jgi:hypothetical protein
MLLRNLRRPGGNGGYQIPSGFLFNIVTCANYTTEIYQWLGFNVATQTVSGYFFLVVATSIMTNWALAKHRRLKKVLSVILVELVASYIFLHFLHKKLKIITLSLHIGQPWVVVAVRSCRL